MSGVPDTALLWIHVTPHKQGDRQRLAASLLKIVADDPAVCVRADRLTGATVIGGSSDLHLEVILDRLKREFDVTASVGRLEVAYRETVTKPSDGEVKYCGYVAGRRHYAHVKIHLYPGERGSGCLFDIVSGAVPKEFVNAVDEGIRVAVAGGAIAGCPMTDTRIVLYDGSYHDVDSSDLAFKIAGILAFQYAAREAEPVLLEPVMRVEVVVPTERTEDVTTSLVRRRGEIQAQTIFEGMRVITARVPLTEMFGYSTDLRERTQGRGSFTMHLDRYEPLRPAERDDGSRDSFVRVPRTPRPPLRSSRIAVPEPDRDDRPTDQEMPSNPRQ